MMLLVSLICLFHSVLFADFHAQLSILIGILGRIFMLSLELSFSIPM